MQCTFSVVDNVLCTEMSLLVLTGGCDTVTLHQGVRTPLMGVGVHCTVVCRGTLHHVFVWSVEGLCSTAVGCAGKPVIVWVAFMRSVKREEGKPLEIEVNSNAPMFCMLYT